MSATVIKPSVFEVKVPTADYDKTVEKLNEVRFSKSFLNECLESFKKYNKN